MFALISADYVIGNPNIYLAFHTNVSSTGLIHFVSYATSTNRMVQNKPGVENTIIKNTERKSTK